MSLHTDLALDALSMGLWRGAKDGQDVTGLLHHSDLACNSSVSGTPRSRRSWRRRLQWHGYVR
jgi:hypothetical protein